MRKYLLLGYLALVSLSALAQGSAVMALGVQGDVKMDVAGKPQALEAFSRLQEEDRVKLGKDGKLTVVYGRTGRQEIWSGAGVIQVGLAQSSVISGKPALEAKELPPKVAQTMIRTPVADSSGKVGMVRVRSGREADDLAALEQNYKEMRKTADPADRNPEIYWLSELFQQRAYDRLKEELARLQASYPKDPTLGALAKRYSLALESAQAPQ